MSPNSFTLCLSASSRIEENRLKPIQLQATTPINLSKVSEHSFAAWREAFAAARMIEDADLQMSWRFVSPDAEELLGQAVELKGDRVRVVVLIERDQRMQDIEMRPWFDYPDASKLLAFALANESLISQLSRWFGDALVPNALIETKQLLAYSRQGLALSYQITQGAARELISTGAARELISTGLLWLTPALLKQLSDQAQPMLVGLPSWLQQLELTISAELDPIEFSVSDLQAMRCGDVLGLGAKSQALAHGLLNVPGYQCWQGKFGKEGIRAQRQITDSNAVSTLASIHSSTHQQDLSMEPLQSAPVDQVNVQLGFELERRAINLAELTQLQAGYVFKLAAPAEGRNVNLLANGKIIGTGELVSVGDFLGVRIVELLR